MVDPEEAAEPHDIILSVTGSMPSCNPILEFSRLPLLLLLPILVAGEGIAWVPRRLISSRSLWVSNSMLLLEICMQEHAFRAIFRKVEFPIPLHTSPFLTKHYVILVFVSMVCISYHQITEWDEYAILSWLLECLSNFVDSTGRNWPVPIKNLRNMQAKLHECELCLKVQEARQKSYMSHTWRLGKVWVHSQWSFSTCTVG